MKIITTSWDDGHELDLRLADLLEKYNLEATFYIPKANTERPVMQPHQMRQLAQRFEVGGHTVSHVRLGGISNKEMEEEVGGSFRWLADTTGKPPVSFCFPGGVYNRRSLAAVFAHGYRVARTTELLRTRPWLPNGTMPTTLQAYEHRSFTYVKHLAKRGRWIGLVRSLAQRQPTDLESLVEHFMNRIETNGGCFHLWGHSWEIEEHNLWPRLERLFSIIANRLGFVYVDNQRFATAPAPTPLPG